MKRPTHARIALFMSLALAAAGGCDETSAQRGSNSQVQETGGANDFLTIVGSCHRPELHFCSDYNAAAAEMWKDAHCSDSAPGKGEWKNEPCPAEGLIGSCSPKGGVTDRFYEDYGIDAAKKECEFKDEEWQGA